MAGDLGIVVAYQFQFHSNYTSQYFDGSKAISTWNTFPLRLRTYVGVGGVRAYDSPTYNNFYLMIENNTIYLVYNCEGCHPINEITGAPASGVTTDWGIHNPLTLPSHDPPDVEKRLKIYVKTSAIWTCNELQIWGPGRYALGAVNNVNEIALGEVIGFYDDYPPNERDLAHPPPYAPQIVIYGNQNTLGEYIHEASGELIDPAYPDDLLRVIINGITYEIVVVSAAQVGNGQNIKYQGESMLKNGNVYYNYVINANGSITLSTAPNGTNSTNTTPARIPFQVTQVRIWRENDVTGNLELWDAYGAWDITTDGSGNIIKWQDIYNALVVGKGGIFNYFYPGNYRIEARYQNALTQPYVKLPNGTTNPASPIDLAIDKTFTVIYVPPEIIIDGNIACDPGDFPDPNHVFINFAKVTFEDENEVITAIDVYYTPLGLSETHLSHIESADLLPIYGVLTFEELMLTYESVGDYRAQQHYTYYTATPQIGETPGPNPKTKTEIFRITSFIAPTFTLIGCRHLQSDLYEPDAYFEPNVTMIINDPQGVTTAFHYIKTPSDGIPLPSTPVVPPPALHQYTEVFSEIATLYELSLTYTDDCGLPAIHTYAFTIIPYIPPTWDIIGTLAEYQTNPFMPQYVGEVHLNITDVQGNIQHITINGTWDEPLENPHILTEIGIYDIQFLMQQPCYPNFAPLQLEIIPPYPHPMLQLGRRTAGNLTPDTPIGFDEVILDNGTITYQLSEGIITFLYTGIYGIYWWISPLTSLGNEGVNFAIITDNGHEIVGSGHVTVGQTTGFAIIEVGSIGQVGRKVSLVNHGQTVMTLSNRTVSQVNILLFKIGPLAQLDYLHLTLTNTPFMCQQNQIIPVDTQVATGLIRAITFDENRLGEIDVWEKGDYKCHLHIQFADTATIPQEVCFELASLINGNPYATACIKAGDVTGIGIVTKEITVSNQNPYDTLSLTVSTSANPISITHASIWIWQENRNHEWIEKSV